MPATTPQRLKRWRRADSKRGESLPPFDLQPRDRDILRLVFELRVATAEILHALLPAGPPSDKQRTALNRAQIGHREWLKHEQEAGRRIVRNTPAAPNRPIQNRLSKLYHHRYLNRLKISNNEPTVYFLARRAVPELTSFYDIDHDKAVQQTRDGKTGPYFVSHTLMIGQFRAHLAQALTTHSASLAFWEPEGSFRSTVTTMDDKPEDIPVIPDAYFGLWDGTQTHHLFLEIDRGTMRPVRFLNKLRGYYEFFTQELHTEHAMDHFRVLTVTPSTARCEILRSTAQQLSGKHGLYWFAPEPAYLKTPHTLFTPIWQTPKSDDLRALLEPPTPPRRQ